ncbi:CARDB domain-containing protein [Candidatus Electronema sp. JC]|uniref:CARDB domain-containing protein n=1 Tax=Candidatus Electronema sp. JC TaxID=3401570 RepID=UPI003B436412
MSLPDSLNDGAAHQIYAYAIDDAGGTNPLLTNSPKTVQCGLTPDQAAAVMSVINELLLEDVPSTAPDLSVINPSASKTSLAPGESLTFSATAKNGGTASSAATTLRWYRSTDATITTADTQLGSQSVGALSAGQTSAQSATLTAPSAAGTYWLGACIDAVSGETNTGNNCSSGVQITVTAPPAAPDLSVINPSASKTSLAPGESLTFSATAKNGGAASSAATTLRWYRSTDATITTADTQLGSQSVSTLSAGQTSAQSATLTAPSAAGTYWLGACIDAVSGETTTGNNCSSGVQITVTAPPAAPDLSVINPSASKTSLAPGESLTFSATAKNGGAASSAATTLRWYRSTDSTITTADTQLGSQAVGALSAGQTSSQSATLAAPSTAGTYWLGACIDAVSGETNTGNNCSSGVQITVTAGKPDLIVSSLRHFWLVDAGVSKDATAEFTNQGTAASVATTAACYYINKATQEVSGAVCQMQVPALTVNQTDSRTATLRAPCSEGTYQLKVCVNPGANAESNTDNNCMYGDLSVVGNCPKKAFLPAVLDFLLK